MPKIYTSQVAVTQNVGPVNSTFAPIPGLETLNVTDAALQFGGTAFINLFLGQVYYSGSTPSFLNVAINEVVSGTQISRVYCTNGPQVSSIINISASYIIPAGTQPQFSATWMVDRTEGAEILVPTTFSFTAMIFESLG